MYIKNKLRYLDYKSLRFYCYVVVADIAAGIDDVAAAIEPVTAEPPQTKGSAANQPSDSDNSDNVADLGSSGLTEHLFRELKRVKPVTVEGKTPGMGDLKALMSVYNEATAATEEWRSKAPKKVISR